MSEILDYKECRLCPRQCGVDRSRGTGYCGCSDQIKIARAALHHWEEPCISGGRGSGAVFFSGCTLRCCFCQNYSISSEGFGKEISVERLSDIFLELQDQGAHNINLVTATMYVPSIIRAIDRVKHKMKIPFLFNCGGYERIETIKMLSDYIDIFLPDIKYYDSVLSKEFSMAEDYFEYASKAIEQMIRQTGKLEYDKEGLLKKGVILRHMVLPGCYKDSIKLLEWMNECLDRESFLVSLMSQYTPSYKSKEHKKINRRLTTFEYEKVLDKAIELGLTDGYMQEKSSAKEEYTPPFNLEGV